MKNSAAFLFTVMAGCTLAAQDPAVQKDRALLDRAQRETFNYAWQLGHPVSGMVPERWAEGRKSDRVTTGGTGFGIAAIVAGAERGWITRADAATRLLTLATFLRDKTARKTLHGAFPHWLNGRTGKTIRFSEKDDGADLVETAFLFEGLLIARAYFNAPNPTETSLRAIVTELWRDVEWNFFTQGAEGPLSWHWSPNHGFAKNLKITGYNESLIVYVLAAASPTHPISRKTFDAWNHTPGYKTRKAFGYTLQGTRRPEGGPLFLAHYSFIGLNPFLISDEFVSKGYGVRNTTQTLVNRAYCLEAAPRENRYSPEYWGLTASDIKGGYTASAPDNDRATIAPTAALSSIAYTPLYAMQALRALYQRTPAMLGPYGPYDASSLRDAWVSESYIAIDQLPIACMIENYRSGLLWRLLMSDPDVQRGLALGGLTPPAHKTGFPEAVVTLKPFKRTYKPDAFEITRHPDTGLYAIPYFLESADPATLTLQDPEGKTLLSVTPKTAAGRNLLTFTAAPTRPTNAVHTLTLKTAASEQTLPVRLY